MSGYKHSGRTQGTYQAMIAYGIYSQRLEDEWPDAWDELDPLLQQLWLRIAAAVRDDTRTEPRF